MDINYDKNWQEKSALLKKKLPQWTTFQMVCNNISTKKNFRRGQTDKWRLHSCIILRKGGCPHEVHCSEKPNAYCLQEETCLNRRTCRWSRTTLVVWCWLFLKLQSQKRNLWFADNVRSWLFSISFNRTPLYCLGNELVRYSSTSAAGWCRRHLTVTGIRR